MNKYLLLIVGPVIILSIAVASYFLYFKKNLPVSQGTPAQQIAFQGEKKTLKELFDSQKDQKCDFNDNAGSTGTVYITLGKLRADYTSVNGQGTIVSHIFTDGQNAYAWNDGQKKGFLMAFSVIADNANPSGNAPATNQKPLYNCSDWTVDSNVFVVPNLEFTQYKDTQVTASEEEVESTPVPDAVNCSLCDNTPEPNKEKCLKSLGCM